MRCLKASWMMAALAGGLLAFAPAWHRAPTAVDLALVLAVDVSTSMDPEEQDLQRQGYVEAFRSPSVHRAIHSGMLGRIAVTYVEWGGGRRLRHQNVVVPWTILESPGDSASFADRLARAPVHRAAGTSIAEAIDFSLVLLSTGHFLTLRRVIDISGDGSNNQGRLITDARDEAVAQGVTINGLPIMLNAPDRKENATIDAYYRDCVIGGSGAFMIPVRDRNQFLSGTRIKIIREIANATFPTPLPQPALARPATDCDTSESFWDDLPPEPHGPVIGSGREL